METNDFCFSHRYCWLHNPPHTDAPTVGRVIFSQSEHTRNCVSAAFGKDPATNRLETSEHVTQQLPSRTSTAIILMWWPSLSPNDLHSSEFFPTESSLWNEKEKESPPPARWSAERGRQVVKHNELNDAKEIMSEYMSEQERYSWSPGRCCHSQKQARDTHTHMLVLQWNLWLWAQF